MQKTIKHFLLTRFNVIMPSSGLSRQLNEIDVATDIEYLTERFRLFKKYTIPSIKSQTSDNFTWIICFDSETPSAFKNQISTLHENNKRFIPIFINENDDLNAKIKEIICSYEADICITSRIDNDDAIAVSYIEEVQKLAREQYSKKYVAIFNDGFQYNEKDCIVSRYHFPKNHFSSLIEVASKPSNIITEFGHMNIGDHLPVREINTIEPMWLEVIHSNNVSNRSHMGGSNSIVKDKNALNRFGIKNIKITTPKNILLYSILILPKNFIRLFRQYGMGGIISKVFKKIKNKVFFR